MTSPRRLAIAVAGGVAAVTLVAVGPGGVALGANPNDSHNTGARGHNSAPSGPGADGNNAIGRGGPSGLSGRTGKQGENGPAGVEIPGGRGRAGANVDLPHIPGVRVGKGLRRGLSRDARQRVRDILAARDIQI